MYDSFLISYAWCLKLMMHPKNPYRITAKRSLILRIILQLDPGKQCWNSSQIFFLFFLETFSKIVSYDPKRKKIQNAKNKAFPRKRHCMEKNITQIVKTREAVIKSGDPTSPKLANSKAMGDKKFWRQSIHYIFMNIILGNFSQKTRKLFFRGK